MLSFFIFGEKGYYVFIATERPAIRSYKCSQFTTHANAFAFIPLLSGLVGFGRNFLVPVFFFLKKEVIVTNKSCHPYRSNNVVL